MATFDSDKLGGTSIEQTTSNTISPTLGDTTSGFISSAADSPRKVALKRRENQRVEAPSFVIESICCMTDAVVFEASIWYAGDVQ
jgi:hypothetical protein